MPITYVHNDIFSVKTEAFVNPVNTKGIMGAGLALEVKKRWPEVNGEYVQACRKGQVQIGRMHVVQRQEANPKYVINFPTKDHWRDKSKLIDIEIGLIDLRFELFGKSSVAIPALGCGLGGLNWDDVKPLIERILRLDLVTVYVFPP